MNVESHVSWALPTALRQLTNFRGTACCNSVVIERVEPITGLQILAVAAVLLVAGCGGDAGPALIPVSGVVTMGGKPTSSGSVSFRDASGLIQADGEIDSDGRYQLFVGRRAGVPEGHYKVVVFVTESGAAQGAHGGLPRVIVNKKFTNPQTTPLETDVNEESPPGSFDFAVER